MILTRSLHPPGMSILTNKLTFTLVLLTLFTGSATALIGVIGSPRIHDAGYYYVLCPAIGASVILVIIGILTNNSSSLPHRRYPVYWFPWSRDNQVKVVDLKTDSNAIPEIDEVHTATVESTETIL